MNNIKFSEAKAKEIEAALSRAGYSSKDRDMCVRYFKGKGDSTYIHHSLNIVRANKNTEGQAIVQKLFGASNGKASPSQNDTYDTWFFNGYTGKKGSSV
jgi:hypothetical protein